MESPKVFVSYSWSTPEHEEWVLNLSTELRESGVDIILDKWDLKEGHDSNAFMERMVTDSSVKKVIIVCDESYANKADKRSGGVGTETQIISSEIYSSVDQDKFVAVIAEKDADGSAHLPTYYKSRIYIDLSYDELYAKNFEQLLRWIFNKPVNIKPGLGKIPSFLSEEPAKSLGTSAISRRCIEAYRNSKPHAHGALKEYFQTFQDNFERFRLEPSGGHREFDDAVIESIQSFIPYRNEAIEVFLTVANYGDTENIGEDIHHFFEQLIPKMGRPENVNQCHLWDWDNLKYIVHELFLYCVAALVKEQKFDVLAILLQQRYFISKDEDYGRNTMRGFGVFRNHLEAFEHRKNRLKLNRKSVHADLIKEFSTGTGITFDYIMQADFLLFIADSIRALSDQEWGQEWWPETLIYRSYGSNTYELFARAESKAFFDRFKYCLGIESKDDLTPLIESFKSRQLHSSNANPVVGLNFDKLCSRP
ncbi:SEFIR domain-containing protein [Microbulbifer sp. JMSA002]|uniref:SEFIR domain-containing protein n=1 Tax=Microbulbifer sp. JMSA002 TaxID=3243368 RepID=UPI004039519D